MATEKGVEVEEPYHVSTYWGYSGFEHTEYTPNPSPRNPKPETRTTYWGYSGFEHTEYTPNPSTRNPKPETRTTYGGC